MLFSYHWLRELSGTKKSPDKLAALLMAHSFEVETVTPYAHSLSLVVVGKVLSVVKHPNADRLRVAEVSVGKQEVKTIVCGAPNLAAHQKVVVALPGASLPGGVSIQASELRGVLSQGMICSAKELGLGSDHAGIIVLSSHAPIGKDFPVYAGLDDTVLDVKILPDRSTDALSYQGLAREIAALEGSQAVFQTEAKSSGVRPRVSAKVPKVSLKTDRCQRYVAMFVPGALQGPSTLTTRVRLVVSGLRPMNRVVDLTNYLMLETGQPVHAFDADAIPKGGIVVRLAKPREKLLLLDGTALALSTDDIVIADTKKPLALAGVMGGKLSGITEKTKDVVFEIANFEAASIRRTEKRHRLLTDAAYRYERGIDLGRPGYVAGQLARFVRDWEIGKQVFVRDTGSKLPKPTVITLELALIVRLLGTKIPLFEVVQYCSWLGLSVKKLPNRQALRVTVPLRRPDLRDPEDLVEEVGRLRGYHLIDPVPLALPSRPVISDPGKAFERSVKSALVASGFSEVMTYSFYSEKSLSFVTLPKIEHLSVANPMNPDQAFMRSELFPNLYRTAHLNAKYTNQFRLFEYGSVFRMGKSGPQEEKRLGLLVFERSSKDAQSLFLRFKAELEALFGRQHTMVRWNAMAAGIPPAFHPSRVAHLTIENEGLGYAGEAHPELARRLGANVSLWYAEFAVRDLMAGSGASAVFHDFSRFPLAHRDISLVGSPAVTFDQLQAVIQVAGAPLLAQCELFDLYENGKEKSFALHLSFGASDRTLGGQEMDQSFDAIVAAVGEHLGMRLKA